MDRAYEWNFAAVARYSDIFINALWVTIQLSVLVVIVGMLAGMLLLALRRMPIPVIPWIATALIEVLRAVPPLVLLVWIYYCLPILTGMGLSSFQTAVIALGLYSAAFYAEIFRAGVQTIDKGLIEAGLSVGMSPGQIFRRIVSPLAFQRVLPPFVSQGVLVIKNTSLAGYISVHELLYQGQRISIEIFRPIEVLTIIALMYIALIVPLSTASNIFEKSYRKRYGL